MPSSTRSQTYARLHALTHEMQTLLRDLHSTPNKKKAVNFDTRLPPVCPHPSPYHHMSKEEMLTLWYHKEDFARFGSEARREYLLRQQEKRRPLQPVHPQRCDTTTDTSRVQIGPNKVGYWV